eukprot:m.175059 g.175059  ORF g.175059 m.175059 type:complete len:450 (-) comp31795_c0_seq4:180-1529(-)
MDDKAKQEHLALFRQSSDNVNGHSLQKQHSLSGIANEAKRTRINVTLPPATLPPKSKRNQPNYFDTRLANKNTTSTTSSSASSTTTTTDNLKKLHSTQSSSARNRPSMDHTDTDTTSIKSNSTQSESSLISNRIITTNDSTSSTEIPNYPSIERGQLETQNVPSLGTVSGATGSRMSGALQTTIDDKAVPEIQGYLTKRGKRNSLSWKKRWFECFPGSDGVIKYYKTPSQNKKNPLGRIYLQNADVEPLNQGQPSRRKEFGFRICTKKRLWEIITKDEKVQSAWLEVLQRECTSGANLLIMQAEEMMYLEQEGLDGDSRASISSTSTTNITITRTTTKPKAMRDANLQSPVVQRRVKRQPRGDLTPFSAWGYGGQDSRRLTYLDPDKHDDVMRDLAGTSLTPIDDDEDSLSEEELTDDDDDPEWSEKRSRKTSSGCEDDNASTLSLRSF